MIRQQFVGYLIKMNTFRTFLLFGRKLAHCAATAHTIKLVIGPCLTYLNNGGQLSGYSASLRHTKRAYLEK